MKKLHRTFFGLLREVFFGDPLQKQYERVEAAVKAKAKCVSDAEFNRTMANFYTERLDSIDPNTDWWEFADAKQKQYDHQTTCVSNDAAVEEAAQIARAEIARYSALQAN
jgi:hypothetical protein